ncbi:SPW repeat protein [Streptomyces sp. NPDC051104]|uniref:SPW repeat protein n=1 Tax=Streptomyces sp. NPDC051104 TaxID=3155044 RepID=UPI00341A25B8
MAQHTTGMTTHPDLAVMRERLERRASSGSAIALAGRVLLAGLHAAIPPWVVHFSAGAPFITVNNLIVGATVALIGFCAALAPDRMLHLAWVVAPLGVWLVISPWVVTATHGARPASSGTTAGSAR